MREKKHFRVLVVDDDKDILELLEYNLEKEGFTVKTIDESQDAVTVAKDFSPGETVSRVRFSDSRCLIEHYKQMTRKA